MKLRQLHHNLHFRLPHDRIQVKGDIMPGKGQRSGVTKNCIQCGKEFYVFPSQQDRRHCSKSCATTTRNLSDKNPSYHRDISGTNNPMYGKGLKGEQNPMYGKRLHLAPRWKGGRKVRKDGYIFVVAPDDHPHPSYTKPNGLKYILEHRHVMEQHLGRYLEPDEVIHHIDKNPSNNTIENLKLFASHSDHLSTGHPLPFRRQTQA